MKALKKFFATILLIAIIVIMSIPFSAFAADGSSGDLSPYLYCEFYKDGVAVDGNSLETGSYTVDIKLSGMSSFYVFQFTADYALNASTAIKNIDVTSTYADSHGDVVCGGIKKDEDEKKLVVILASDNDDYSSINPEGTTLVTLAVDIQGSNVDFVNSFYFTRDADLTFVQAVYGTGENEIYYELTTDSTHKMTADESPAFVPDGYNVSGKIAIATAATGEHQNTGIIGITVDAYQNGDLIATDVTAADGTYLLDSLPTGEYTLRLHGDTTVDRDVNLTVSADKATGDTIIVDTVGIVICDYTFDNLVDANDKGEFNKYYNKLYYVYADFTSDGEVDANDKGEFNKFYNKIINYTDIDL